MHDHRLSLTLQVAVEDALVAHRRRGGVHAERIGRVHSGVDGPCGGIVVVFIP